MEIANSKTKDIGGFLNTLAHKHLGERHLSMSTIDEILLNSKDLNLEKKSKFAVEMEKALDKPLTDMELIAEARRIETEILSSNQETS